MANWKLAVVAVVLFVTVSQAEESTLQDLLKRLLDNTYKRQDNLVCPPTEKTTLEFLREIIAKKFEGRVCRVHGVTNDQLEKCDTEKGELCCFNSPKSVGYCLEGVSPSAAPATP